MSLLRHRKRDEEPRSLVRKARKTSQRPKKEPGKLYDADGNEVDISSLTQQGNQKKKEKLDVPLYDVSNGYPKGIPEGVAVVRTVEGVRKVLHGEPWEKLPKYIQEDLDKNPLDDKGQLRIFLHSYYVRNKARVGDYYNEMSSDEHVEGFRNSLWKQGDRLL